MNFIKKIFSPSILIISLLLLFYTFYRSEITYGGEKRHYYYTYYFISFLLIFISVGTFYINQRIKEYLIIITISFSRFIFYITNNN